MFLGFRLLRVRMIREEALYGVGRKSAQDFCQHSVFILLHKFVTLVQIMCRFQEGQLLIVWVYLDPELEGISFLMHS